MPRFRIYNTSLWHWVATNGRSMLSAVQLPEWLDAFLFDTLEAQYCRTNSDMTVIDWDRSNIKNYLGTYFPRSYCESYCIWNEFLTKKDTFFTGDSISILDFGCGTGGEFFGLISAIEQHRPNIKNIIVKAFDGNQFALREFEAVADEYQKQSCLKIEYKPSAVTIDDIYDLEILNNIFSNDYDIIISFKAVCEFVTKQQFEERNPYEHLGNFLLPKLKEDGVLLFVDVTSYNDTCHEWLPKMMDKGLSEHLGIIIWKNEGYNHTFTVSHSHKYGDISKVAWRMIQKTNNY